MDYKIKENHFQGGWDDRSILEVNHYNERGLDLRYFWQRILFKPTPSNEDMEAARLEACNVFLKLGGHVIITILDSLAIPENDRNAPIDLHDDNGKVVEKEYGWPAHPKKRTGDPGDQYYDWTPITPQDVEQRRLNQVRKLLKQERGRK